MISINRLTVLSCLLLVALASFACKGGGDTAGFEHKNDAANLGELWSAIGAAAKAGDHAKLSGLAKSLLLDDASFKVALREGADAAIIETVKKQQSRMRDAKSEDMLKGFKPERSEVTVHAATPKEIVAQETPAAKEFPGGAVRAAQSILNEEVTFYEVELIEPGKELGTKMHLMFWDGKQWRMLGAVWRGMPR